MSETTQIYDEDSLIPEVQVEDDDGVIAEQVDLGPDDFVLYTPEETSVLECEECGLSTDFSMKEYINGFDFLDYRLSVNCGECGHSHHDHEATIWTGVEVSQ